jgi:hypothetical protein
MTPRERVRAAMPMTLVAWLAPLALALIPALEARGALWRSLGHRPDGTLAAYEPGGALGLEVLHRVGQRAGGDLTWLVLGTALLLLLLGPWLCMAWLAALKRRRPLLQCLRLGLARYLPSLGTSLVTHAVGLAALAATLLLPATCHLLLRGQPDARLHDLVVMAATVPALAVLVTTWTAHDLARGFLAHAPMHPLEAVRRAVATLAPGVIGVHLAHRLLGTVLAAAAAATALWPSSGPVAVGTVVIIGQLTALARTAVRARWLAVAVHATRAAGDVTPGSESPAPHAAGSTPPTR